mmetsp:Transcript_38709/g.82339  ORF Transcript_38709/g.82339 Transcript_38709/m.82339 type:complete len:214 (+) Transcript_38709:263-904(+)
MKPDWDKLMEEFGDQKHAGIYDVDCTAGGESLCTEVGVQGYPTIKFGDPSDGGKNLKDYTGERTLGALKHFAEQNLGPVCGPNTLDACDPEEKEQLEGYLKMTAADLAGSVKSLGKQFSDKQKKLTKKKNKLQDKWDAFKEDDRDYKKSKPKKGKEKQHEEKGAKIEERRTTLQSEQDAFDKEAADLKEEEKKSGLKLMKAAAKVVKPKEGEL